MHWSLYCDFEYLLQAKMLENVLFVLSLSFFLHKLCHFRASTIFQLVVPLLAFFANARFFLFICRSFAAVMVTNPLKQRELFISSRASFQRYTSFYPFTPKSGQSQKIIQQNFQISLCEILKNKEYRVNVLLKRFHLNGNTIWFHPQTQKLELHNK